jgi:hypothetical protein
MRKLAVHLDQAFVFKPLSFDFSHLDNFPLQSEKNSILVDDYNCTAFMQSGFNFCLGSGC